MYVDSATSSSLRAYGLDLKALDEFADRAHIEAPRIPSAALTANSKVTVLPCDGTPEREQLTREGLDALAQGRTGFLVLAGGMATRFGGVVKAAVPVLEERSFLELKLSQVRRLCRKFPPADVRLFVMSSFATDAELRVHVAERKLAPLSLFSQFVSLRLTSDGQLYRDAAGAVSPYATGHGDLPFAFASSGLLDDFRRRGGQWLVVSNVDNLGATLDPALLALHRRLGKPMTAEVVVRDSQDRGGVIACVEGSPQIIEGFRIAPGADLSHLRHFNTNTFIFDVDALAAAPPLPFHRVEKVHEGASVIQFERLLGELSAFLPSAFVEVPRSGRLGRFLPVKELTDLEQRRTEIAERLNHHL